MDELAVIDAHQHFWDPTRNYHPWLCDEPPIPFRYGDYRALRKPYLPGDYRRDTRDFAVVGTVYIETEWDPSDPLGETRWAERLADEEGLPSAIVAQAWLDREDVAAVLAAQAAFGRVRGIRHKPAAATAADEVRVGAPGSMSDPRWRAGYALLERHGLHFELQTPWWHLPEALDLARAFPDILIVLNHTGLPADRSDAGLRGWHAAMQSFAAAPNVAVKISGIGVPGVPWTAAGNRRVVRDTIALFGVERCMFASNFPVDGLVGDFATIYGGFMEIVADLAESDRRALFHDNAVRYYRL